MAKIVTFGEIMLRLSPPGHLRFGQSPVLEQGFGGGEANVAVSLAGFGHQPLFVTRLPGNEIAESAIRLLRGRGVDTAAILRGGGRMGLYFLEAGAAQRASNVIYDRAHSAVAEIDPAELDWERLLAGAAWFHFTGITPAISENAARAAAEGAACARRLGIPVSCDVNYRRKLWSLERAREVMTGLAAHVDYLIGGIEDAEGVFGVGAGPDAAARPEPALYPGVAERLVRRFGFKGVAMTRRESHSASHNGWSAFYYAGGTGYFSRVYEIQPIVDRVGGGDAFSAGLIHGLATGRDPQGAIEFAAAAGCLKHSIAGDFNLASLAEVEALAAGDGSGRVRR